MPASQLKRLKASLRAEGLIGPQPSKTEKKRQRKSGVSEDRKIRRVSALQNIREQFNPFETQIPSQQRAKFEVTSLKNVNGKVQKSVKGRPGVSKGYGEEKRRRTLLQEMNQRNKVGGVMDRRFGENDPTMAPEEKMLERFVREKQRRFRNSSKFNLEDDQDGVELTHFGQALSLGNSGFAELKERRLSDSDDARSESPTDLNPRKRKRLWSSEGETAQLHDHESPSAKPKSRDEVMNEVITKSKIHRHERQQAKDDDEDERERLDQEMSDILVLMKGGPHAASRPEQETNSTVQGLLQPHQVSQSEIVKNQEYDQRLREMVLDRRSRPTDRSKTEEEKVFEKESKERAREDEQLRRMRESANDSDVEESLSERLNYESKKEAELDDAKHFGLGLGITRPIAGDEMGVEDEDNFILDDNLIANDSADERSNSDTSLLVEEAGSLPDLDNDEEIDFVAGLAMNAGVSQESSTRAEKTTSLSIDGAAQALPCPQDHGQFLDTTADVAVVDLPMVVKQIRSTYSAELGSGNRVKLGVFAAVLVKHIVYLADLPKHPPLNVLESLMRHVHSLAKTYAIEVANAFRTQLRPLHQERPTSPTPGDVLVFTAILSIFPTSDHFHQVVSPAILCMGRYLNQKRPEHLSDLAIGACIVSLCLQYQRIAKRYMPEVVNYVLNAIAGLAPIKIDFQPNSASQFALSASLQITQALTDRPRRLRFWDVLALELSREDEKRLKGSLLNTFIALVDEMATLWMSHSAFVEVFGTCIAVLQQLQSQTCCEKITPLNARISDVVGHVQALLDQSRRFRRPLALHHHRPLAIKASIPKFEESYNPDKHYDPNRGRLEVSKLKAEHNRERKAALRELRKDANFVSRETLREKKEADAEYEKKFKRLAAEIQGEEAHEAKSYEREKRLRKKKRST